MPNTSANKGRTETAVFKHTPTHPHTSYSDTPRAWVLGGGLTCRVESNKLGWDHPNTRVTHVGTIPLRASKGDD